MKLFKKILTSFLLFAMVIAPIFLIGEEANASPNIISDPATGIIPDTFEWLGMPPTLPATSVAEPDGSVKYDLALSPAGTFNVQVRACKNDTLWGRICSDYVPFEWSRPGSPSLPVNIHLSK